MQPNKWKIVLKEEDGDSVILYQRQSLFQESIPYRPQIESRPDGIIIRDGINTIRLSIDKMKTSKPNQSLQTKNRYVTECAPSPTYRASAIRVWLLTLCKNMKPRRLRPLLLLLVLSPFYVVSYFASSALLEPKESYGGLAGPRLTRLFISEKYIVLFYPIYLSERIIRNEDFFRASTYFNCDFVDEIYNHNYLYGDGTYSKIWYDFWKNHWV